MPSRASIQTGQYINRHGVWRNGCRLSVDAVTIPKVLGKAGVDCAHFGKLHVEPIINRVTPPHSYGYPAFEISEGDQQLTTDSHFSCLRTQYPEIFLQYINEMYQNGHNLGYCSQLPEKLHMTHFVTDQAVNWLETGRDRSRPFFLSVGYFDPHHAFNPVEPYYSHFKDAEVPEPLFREGDIIKKPAQYQIWFDHSSHITRNPKAIKTTIRAFHAMMEHIDTNIGRLIDALQKQGLANDTLILFSSDHGEFLGNHGLLHKGPFLLNDLCHVPMIASIPYGQKRNIVCDEYTSGIDFMATVTRIFNAEKPEGPGIPMLDCELRKLPEGSRGYALCEWEGEQCGMDLSLRCIQNKDYKLVTYADNAVGELYDLKSDPHEFNNVYGYPDYTEAEKEMRNLLATCYQTPRPNNTAECMW